MESPCVDIEHISVEDAAQDGDDAQHSRDHIQHPEQGVTFCLMLPPEHEKFSEGRRQQAQTDQQCRTGEHAEKAAVFLEALHCCDLKHFGCTGKDREHSGVAGDQAARLFPQGGSDQEQKQEDEGAYFKIHPHRSHDPTLSFPQKLYLIILTYS